MTSLERACVTDVIAADGPGIARAAALISDGQIVAVPTETVYGLAADATDGRAVARIYAAKSRPSFNPLIVHCRDQDHAVSLAELDEAAIALAEAFWPGPLTIVAPRRARCPVAAIAAAGLDNIALRVPAHPAMQALLTRCRLPLAAPSANRSGALSPTTAAHVLASLGGRVPLVLDGGACALGMESTIVATGASGGTRLLRPGPISAEAIAAITGGRVAAGDEGAITAPGQLASHYAPAKPLRLDATRAGNDEYLIGFGAVTGAMSLSRAGDLVEAAAALFAALHAADAAPESRIAIAPIPSHGLGAAIRDRLRAPPRPHPDASAARHSP